MEKLRFGDFKQCDDETKSMDKEEKSTLVEKQKLSVARKLKFSVARKLKFPDMKQKQKLSVARELQQQRRLQLAAALDPLLEKVFLGENLKIRITAEKIKDIEEKIRQAWFKEQKPHVEFQEITDLLNLRITTEEIEDIEEKSSDVEKLRQQQITDALVPVLEKLKIQPHLPVEKRRQRQQQIGTSLEPLLESLFLGENLNLRITTEKIKDIENVEKLKLRITTEEIEDIEEKNSDVEKLRMTTAYASIEDKSSHVEKKNSTKVFFLCGTDSRTRMTHFIVPSLSTDTSIGTMTWELGCRALCYDVLPDKCLDPNPFFTLTGATSMVFVGSEIYCIGGDNHSNLPSSCVYAYTLNGSYKCSHMKQKRAFPAVVYLGRKIYVFGGLPPFKEHFRPWAEYLDTNKPKEEQEWKALQDPIFPHPCSNLGCTQLFAFPYDDQTILIGCGVLPNEDAILYNVADNSWSRYGSFPTIRPWCFARPVTVVSDKTIYWIEGTFLMAYELDKRVHLRADLSQAVFSYEAFLSPAHSPRLVHLEDDLFGFFTFIHHGYPTEVPVITVVECTKVRVTKDHPGTLSLSVVGYQAYQCNRIDMLSSVVSLEAGSATPEN